MKQEQLLDPVSRDVAEQRFRDALGELVPTGIEEIPIDRALGRVLAVDVRGEIVLRARDVLTSRETGILAAMGLARVKVFLRPKVAILSIGDELIAPGEAMTPGKIYDSNLRVLADAVRECGGEPVAMGIVADDPAALGAVLARALAGTAAVLLSGGTSRGPGDLRVRALEEVLSPPGIVVHGVALEPGKSLCLAVSGREPVVILPGLPTAAILTFHELVAPVIRAFAGRAEHKLVRLIP